MIENVEIGIANFKPFGEKVQRFKLKPITLVFGPNSIGKSSLIHSIAYLQNIYKNQNFNPGEITFGDKISIGGFSQFIHKKDIDKDITLEFKYNNEETQHDIDVFRTTHNRMRTHTINENKKKTERKSKILNATNEEIKKDLFASLPDFEDDGYHALINWYDDSLTIHFYKYLSFLEQFFNITSKTDQLEEIQNTPDQELQQFLNNASKSTNDFFNSLSPLYTLDKDISEYWLSFNYKDYSKRLVKASTDTIDKLVEDIKKDLYARLDSSTYSHDEVPDMIDDSIKVKTTIGRMDNGKIQDKHIQYFVGGDLLLDARLVKNPISEEEWNVKQEKNAHQSPLMKHLSRFNREDISENLYNEYVYNIKLHANHWFIQNILEDIEEEGGWKEDDANDEQKSSNNELNISNFVDDILHYKNASIPSILLAYQENNAYDLDVLLNWTPACETASRSIDVLDSDYKLYKSEGTYDSTFDEWESDYYEGERVYKNAMLYEYLQRHELNSLNEVLVHMINNWMQYINSTIKTENKTLHYIGPLRFFPERHDFSFSDKLVTTEDSESVWQLVKENNSIKTELNKWLSSEKLKTPYELQFHKHIQINQQRVKQIEEIIQAHPNNALEEIEKNIPYINEMTFYDKRYDTPVNIREMGLGISQVLPVLVNLFLQTNRLVAIEQPELHLHPSVQSDLADEFIKSYKRNNNNLLIETHSEHLLLRIMRRMRQTSEGTLEDKELALTPDDVSLLYVDADNDKTYILELELAEDGSLLDPWPGGFFEEGFRERFL